MIVELGFSVDTLNQATAVGFTGLAIGCIFFIPFVHKYGRRSLYLFSSALQLAAVIWQGNVKTVGDLMGANIVSGLGGAISETVVQITIADLFFVHQHGTMNGVYLMFTATGAFLGPVAAGFVVNSQGWRWIWWWCTIFLTINLVLVVFLFEESKYIPITVGHSVTNIVDTERTALPGSTQEYRETDKFQKDAGAAEQESLERSHSGLDTTIPLKTYRQRLSLITKSEGPIGHHFYQPIITLFCFPAVAYTALTYGTVLACFSILTSVQAVYLLRPPYNFGSMGVGLMNIAPFIGACLGFFVGGYLNDKSIMWLSKRNRGIYEPEMRLWFALIATIFLPGGVLMFGLGLARVRLNFLPHISLSHMTKQNCRVHIGQCWPSGSEFSGSG
ncbi:MFS general substrate transporter [Melanomma pulvis-pyrius CBS 109.77]|uniref:MFS general substrate transporter n=1 Tax=Melanomma pulvis-pyrius CBS 109.77 TaxID=1314802 RepID=A0A6A6X7R2_9PLEO|nr:MFS general substrate transporter [Melanomma pulvis-pyrius CBS 109.77]